MLGKFSEEAKTVLLKAKEEMFNLRHPYVGSEHLLLAILKYKNEVSNRLKQYKIDYKILKEEIIKIVGVGTKSSEWFIYTPLLKRIIENAMIDSKDNNDGEVTINHLFSSLLEEGEGVAIRIMLGLDINLDELYSDFSFKLVNKKSKSNKKLLLEELGTDLTKQALEKKLDPVIGRDNEVKRAIEILSRRTKNNPILIGEAGVGKTAIVEQLAQLIVNSEVPNCLKNKRIITLDMSTTVAGTKYRGEFEERMKKVLKEIEENEDIILFIDEIHTLVGAGGAEGAIDASNIFKPALARNKLRCIGATTIDEYKKFIEKDSALERRFQKVLIEEPNDKTLLDILTSLKPIYESYHKVIVENNLINLIISLSKKYIYDRNEPDKSIDILDEVCARVSLKESKSLKEYNQTFNLLQSVIKEKQDLLLDNNFKKATMLKEEEKELTTKLNNLQLLLLKDKKTIHVTAEDIAEVIALKTNIPVYEILKDDKKIINKIKKELSKKVIGQENAVNKLINISKKIKLGYLEENKCHSFMFCGPSGVGKTSLAKTFASNLVGNKNVIKLDMSEYTEAHSISKIIGSPPGYVGYSDNKNILEQIKIKPHSVLILDELEKAHSNIINLFYQIFDEGSIKDSKGKTIRFDNTIIIMTSNIGFNDINIGFSKTNIVSSKLKDYFNLPFINRIDEIIMFNKLTEDNIKELINIKLNNLKKRYLLRNIKISINKNIINQITKLSNYEEFGARKLDKIIKDNIESIVIEQIMDGNNKIFIKTIEEEMNV